MSTVLVIMKTNFDLVRGKLREPHEVFDGTMKECKERVRGLNDRAVKNLYYIKRAPLVEGKKDGSV